MARKYKLVYVGTTPEAEVIGLGVFKRDQVVTFEDAEQIEKAKQLVETNINFKEAEK